MLGLVATTVAVVARRAERVLYETIVVMVARCLVRGVLFVSLYLQVRPLNDVVNGYFSDYMLFLRSAQHCFDRREVLPGIL